MTWRIERNSVNRRVTTSETLNRKSLQGHFLVAAPQQLDPNFVEAVILVVEQADRGAFGVIVNCPGTGTKGSRGDECQAASAGEGPGCALAVR